LGGYRLPAGIGFLVGTLYHYRLMRYMMRLYFEGGVFESSVYLFPWVRFGWVLLSFILLYEGLVWLFARRIRRSDFGEIMGDG